MPKLLNGLFCFRRFAFIAEVLTEGPGRRTQFGRRRAILTGSEETELHFAGATQGYINIATGRMYLLHEKAKILR